MLAPRRSPRQIPVLEVLERIHVKNLPYKGLWNGYKGLYDQHGLTRTYIHTHQLPWDYSVGTRLCFDFSVGPENTKEFNRQDYLVRSLPHPHENRCSSTKITKASTTYEFFWVSKSRTAEPKEIEVFNLIRFCQTALCSVFTNLNYHWGAWKFLRPHILKTVCRSIKCLPLWQAWHVSVYLPFQVVCQYILYVYCLYTMYMAVCMRTHTHTGDSCYLW